MRLQVFIAGDQLPEQLGEENREFAHGFGITDSVSVAIDGYNAGVGLGFHGTLIERRQKEVVDDMKREAACKRWTEMQRF